MPTLREDHNTEKKMKSDLQFSSCYCSCYISTQCYMALNNSIIESQTQPAVNDGSLNGL